ncbi:MAG: hypothetical protein WAM69_14580, partial [Candidatus Sulfotelmatobacter sp.]
MRKWMRERLTRRKKTPVEASDQPAPPPLQPAYFDAAEPAGPAADTGRNESEVSAPSPPEPRPVRRARSNSEEQLSQEPPFEAQPASSGNAPGSST